MIENCQLLGNFEINEFIFCFLKNYFLSYFTKEENMNILKKMVWCMMIGSGAVLFAKVVSTKGSVNEVLFTVNDLWMLVATF